MWKITHCEDTETFTSLDDAMAWIRTLTRNKARFSVTYVYHRD